MAEQWKLKIDGMTCNSCKTHVEKALLPFVADFKDISVNWQGGSAEIFTDSAVDLNEVGEKISKAGYSLKSMVREARSPSRPMDNRKEYDFDLIIIGGGSAGFGAAIQAAELEKSVIMIEHNVIGGTCVNVGCVPSKFLINRASQNDAGNWPTDMTHLVNRMREEKYEKVLSSYSDFISYDSGHATVIDPKTVELDSGRRLTGGAVLIATGSHTVLPEIPGADNVQIHDSQSLLALPSTPESVIIIGGRFVALELGQAFSRLGSKVTILQRSSRLIPDHEPEISDSIRVSLEEEGIEVLTDVVLKDFKVDGPQTTVRFQQHGRDMQRTGSNVLSALGRRGNTGDLGLRKLGVALDSTGRIQTDRSLRAHGANIYAAGDVVASPSLVYVAAKEGQIAARNALSSEQENISWDNIPDVIFTTPQIAQVGLTLRKAEANGIQAEKSVLPLSESPYAAANEITGGAIVLVRETGTHKLLGGQVVAPNAGDMIQVLTIAIEAGWTTERLQNQYFPYLTGVEGLKLAAITFSKDVAKLSCCAV